jgi:hypothetical protein
MPKNNLPSVDNAKSAADSIRQDVELKEQITKSTIAIEAAASQGYVPQQIDVRMSRSQAEKFKAIQRELEDAGATLKDGSPVNNRRRAVLWMIENYIGV